MHPELKQFTAFLESINLKKYRDKYKHIKIVEMDMPKNIQAIELLYKVYWNEKNLLTFDDFYKRYLQTYKKELEIFREKSTLCKDCFYRGLPARIYRTWASLITQIHGGYVAESIFGMGTTEMSAELDHNGIDFKVEYKGKIINYQVKKVTHSREVRREKGSSKKIDGEMINIFYEVPPAAVFDNKYKKNGDFKAAYKRFDEDEKIDRLSNGFIIFTPKLFTTKKAEIDSGVRVIS